jgi:hypothetical protein
MQTTEDVEKSSDRDKDKLERHFLQTNERTDGNVVYCDIVSVNLVDENKLKVEFELPSGRKESETMDFPEPMTDNHKWVRMCDSVGVDPKIGPRITDADISVPVTRQDGIHSIHPYANSSGFTADMIKTALALVYWALLPAFRVLKLHTEKKRGANLADNDTIINEEEDLIFASILAVFWQIILFITILAPVIF